VVTITNDIFHVRELKSLCGKSLRYLWNHICKANIKFSKVSCGHCTISIKVLLHLHWPVSVLMMVFQLKHLIINLLTPHLVTF